MNTKLEKTQKALLLVAGAILTVIGIYILVSPVEFYASNDIEIGTNPSLLNELKAPAGLLLAAGSFMLTAIFVQNQRHRALSLAALIYLSYALSRFASMVLDGAPATGLVQAAALETVLGFACLLVLMLRRPATGRAG